MEAFCSMLCADNFAERWYPYVLGGERPLYHDSVNFIMHILGKEAKQSVESASIPQAYLQDVQAACKMRSLFMMNHYMGLAPKKKKQIGDEVVILFGSATPLVVRRVGHESDASSYHLVRICYAHGLMQGQPVVGDLPLYIKDVYGVNSMANFFLKGYMDVRKAGSVFPEDDPRVASFLSGIARKGLLESPTSADLQRTGPMRILKAAGVPIEPFHVL